MTETHAPVDQLVTIGASAGGIETLCALVATLPLDFPAPIIVAQHLDPTRISHLEQILARRSTLPVRTVTDREVFVPGVVYVVPSDRHIAITDHQVSVEQDGAGRPKPSIDRLFRTAAQTFGERLIAVVLSGLGSDGAAGARYVKEAGGTVVIQNPRTAPYPAMPESLAPSTVDVIADIDAMGTVLRDLLIGAYTPSGPSDDRQLRDFLIELRDRSGIDFGQYKAATIQRRLQRRLIATGTHTLEEYRAHLDTYPEEYDRLINAFLIKVTQFFRDADLFEYLRERLVPELIERGRERGRELRLWSAGCATGEEAYSLALLVADALGDELPRWAVRIFATDLDHDAVEFARRGIYPAAALEGMPPDLLARYLVARGDGTFTATKAVRDLLVFGEHDLGQRAPFPRIDLCLCRNVLIYFTPALQRRALESFAFALRDGGYLALGKAETAGPLPGYFTPADAGLRIFRRGGGPPPLPLSGDHAVRMDIGRPGRRGLAPPAVQELARVRREIQQAQAAQLATEELLLRLPIGVAVVDSRYDVRRINTAARRLFGIRTEAVGEDLIHLAQGVPARELRVAIDAALAGRESILDEVATDAVLLGETRYLRIVCQPQSPGQNGRAETAVLAITDVTDKVRDRESTAEARALANRYAEENRALLVANDELATAVSLLRSDNEEYVLGGEEIQAATEEVETLNEELQATNEELETLNEEQQATNEELETLNSELRIRQQEAQQLADLVEAQRRRLAAILDSMGEAVAVVDRDGGYVFKNAPFDALLEVSGGQLRGEDSAGIPLPLAATPLERVRGGATFQLEFTLSGPGDLRRWYEALGRPVRDDAPHQDAVLVIRDITDRTLRQLQDDFLALANHELRTPLTAFRGYVDLLDRGLVAGADTARLRSHAARARAQAVRMAVLVDDLLDVGRLGHGELPLRRAPLNLHALAARAMETASVLDPARELCLDAPDETLSIDGDADRLEQVILNLLTNALVYAPEGPITIELRRERNAASLAIKDVGPGIPADALPHLFERFYRAQQAEHVMGKGLGLGLYIAREIIMAHGGAITVDSVLGQGTTFTIRLPLLPDGDTAMASIATEV